MLRKARGISSVGRVPHWQCGCQRFESGMLHQKNSILLGAVFIYTGKIGGGGPRGGFVKVRVSNPLAFIALNCLISWEKQPSLSVFEHILNILWFISIHNKKPRFIYTAAFMIYGSTALR